MIVTVNGIQIYDAQEGLIIHVEASDGEEMGPVSIVFSTKGVFTIRGVDGHNDGAAVHVAFQPPPNLVQLLAATHPREVPQKEAN